MSRTTANAGPAQLDTTNEQANVRQKEPPMSSFHIYRYTDIMCWKNLCQYTTEAQSNMSPNL